MRRYRNIFRAMLLPVLLLALTLWISTGVVAGSGDTVFTLTLQFNDQIDSYTVDVTNPDGTPVQHTVKDTDANGSETLEIVYDSNVKVTINPKAGKTPSVATITGDGYFNNQSWQKTTTLTLSSFDASYTLKVECVDREYKIYAQNFREDFDGDLEYLIADPESWTLGLNALRDGTLTYQNGRTPMTELPVVMMPNYTFEGWYLVTGDVKHPIQKDANGKYFLPTDLSMFLQHFDSANGIITVYPDFKPVEYAVYRADYIYQEGAPGNQGARLNPDGNYASALRPTGTRYSAVYVSDDVWCAWADDVNGYFTYAGYTVIEDPSIYPEVSPRVTKPKNDPMHNLATRFYSPISYKLTYENVFGTYSSATTYSYGTETAITAPTRRGYTFTGWTVMVYKNGAWQTASTTGTEFSLGSERVSLEGGVRNDPNAIYASDKQEDGTYEIRLIANWQANTYGISYDWNVVDTDLYAQIGELNATLTESYNKFVFDSGTLSIPAPVRVGYNFIGWTLTYTENEQTVTVPYQSLTELIDENGVFALSASTYASNITLIAEWEAKVFDVILDPGANATGGELTLLPGAVKYDGKLTVLEEQLSKLLPTRRGYTCTGFNNADGTPYILFDEEGNATVLETVWTVDSNNGTVTLYAQWQVNFYEIKVNLNDATIADSVIVTVIQNGTVVEPLEDGYTWRLEYGTTFSVRIETVGAYKLVAFAGNAVAHTRDYLAVDGMVVDVWEEAYTFAATVLPVQALTLTKEDNVDYKNEKIINLVGGKYIVKICEADGTVIDTKIFENVEDVIEIADAWFGKTLVVVWCGDGTTADSDEKTLALASRPNAPTVYNPDSNPNGEINKPICYRDKIEFSVRENWMGLFEFAILEKGADGALVWQTEPIFTEGIKPGTYYDLYVRYAATNDAPYGLVKVFEDQRTKHTEYVNEKKAELEALLDETSGEVAKKLIEDAMDAIDGFVEDDDFYEKVEELVESIRNGGIALANKKDEELAKLADVYNGCLASGIFTDANLAEIERLKAEAEEAIKNAADAAEAEEICEQVKADMKKIPVHALKDANDLIILESLLGLDQDNVLTLIRNYSIEDISRLIGESIRTSGKVTTNGYISVEEAEQILRALDVVAYYKFNLTGSKVIQKGDKFAITMQIPKDLRGMTGLQVAYYNEKTGTVELLETEVSRDGKTLTFYTAEIRNFVLLADPTVNLLGVIIALGCVLLLQLIAFVMILVSRHKNKLNSLHASVALPLMLLTVHYAPVNGEVIALALAAAVIVMQIILMILLLSSKAVYRPKTRTPIEEDDGYAELDGEEESAPAEQAEAAEDSDAAIEQGVALGVAAEIAEGDAEADPFEIYESEEEFFADVPEDEGKEFFEEVPAEEDEAFFAEVAADENEEFFAETAEEDADFLDVAAEGEIFDAGAEAEEFIEPAPETRYSLPDEVFAELDADEAEESTEGFDPDAIIEEAFEGGTDEAYDEYAEEGEANVEEIFDEVVTENYYANNEVSFDELFDEAAAEAYAEETDDAVYEDGVAEAPEAELEPVEAVDEEAYFDADEEIELTAEAVEDDTDPMYRYDE